MGRLRELRARLSTHLHRAEVESALDDDIAFHLEQQIAKNLRRGMTPAEARRAARLAFGGIEAHKEAVRDEVRLGLLEDLAKDLAFGWRLLARSPLFAAVAVASLALGIGANTTLFSVVHGVLLRPLPYPAAERLVAPRVLDTGAGRRGSSFSVADLLAVREGVPAFSALGAYFHQPGGMALTGGDAPEQLRASHVTPGVLAALGVEPALGRRPRAGEDAPGGEPLVVLSHGLWQRRFGGSPEILGRRLTLDGTEHAVVGVMPPGFHLPGIPDDDLWPVLQLEPPSFRAPFWLWPVARLAPGASLEEARAQLAAVAAAVKDRYPGSPPQWAYSVADQRDELVADARGRLVVLLLAVALVLLLAAMNVANLLLARATARAPELALRATLGARRPRLLRQMMAEALLLAVLGGGLGLLLALAGVPALLRVLPADVPRLDEVGVDGVVLAFTAAVALGTGLLVGLMPALQVPREALGAAAREGARTGTDRRRGLLRSALVVAEIAIALTVLICAGLVGRSLLRLQSVDTGTTVEDALIVRLALPEGRHPDSGQVAALLEELRSRIAALPGVEAVGLGMAVPPHRLVMTNPFTPEGTVHAPGAAPPLAEELLVTPGYFASLGIPLGAGRDFTAADRADAPLVAIVNRTLARRWFPRGEAVGRWLQTGEPHPDADRLTIVGVVGDVKYQGPGSAPEPTIYVPFAQNLWWRNFYLVVGTRGDPYRLAEGVRARVASVDPQVPLQEVTTLAELGRESVAQPRFQALLLGGFALLALLLAAAGVYALMAYSVQQRRRDTGIRLALGARPAEVLRAVLVDGLRLAVPGAALGLAGALLATRLLDGLLFEVGTFDLGTFGSMAAFLTVVTLAACLRPAWRAAGTDPMGELRAE